MKEQIEKIYRNWFAPQTLIDLGINDKWEEGYRAIGKALKEVIESE